MIQCRQIYYSLCTAYQICDELTVAHRAHRLLLVSLLVTCHGDETGLVIGASHWQYPRCWYFRWSSRWRDFWCRSCNRLEVRVSNQKFAISTIAVPVAGLFDLCDYPWSDENAFAHRIDAAIERFDYKGIGTQLFSRSSLGSFKSSSL